MEDTSAARAPLSIPVDLKTISFGDDAIMRTDGPTSLRSGGVGIPEAATLGTNCRTGCPTQDHASWGDCARAANLRVAYCGIGGGDATEQKRHDQELSLYRTARKQGVQPDGTRTHQIMAALKASETHGAAYGRDFSAAAPMPADAEAA